MPHNESVHCRVREKELGFYFNIIACSGSDIQEPCDGITVEIIVALYFDVQTNNLTLFENTNTFIMSSVSD